MCSSPAAKEGGGGEAPLLMEEAEEMDSSPVADVGGGGGERPLLTAKQALAYVKAVKYTFKHDAVKYRKFLSIMKEGCAGNSLSNGTISAVKDLFKGHRDLILAFNAFLPEGREIKLTPKELTKMQPDEFERALKHAYQVKRGFRGASICAFETSVKMWEITGCETYQPMKRIKMLRNNFSRRMPF